MSQFNVAQAKAQFSELVQRALAGEEVTIARDNKPLMRLIPLASATGKRRPGSAKGLVSHIAPDFGATPDDFGECR